MSATHAFHRDQRGLTGAEKALLLCVGLAMVVLIGELVRSGADTAGRDAARTLRGGMGRAGDIGQVLSPIQAADRMQRPGESGQAGDPKAPPPAPGEERPSTDANAAVDVSLYVGKTMTAEAALREIYSRGARQISEEALRMVRSGEKTVEEAARWAVGARNELKAALRDRGSPIVKALAEARNINKYGNKLGPSYDDLIRQGKTPEDIIGKAGRANARVDRAASRMKIAGRVLIALDVAILTWDVVSAPEGERLRTAVAGTGEIGGALAGGWAGAKGGAALGGLIGSIFPGPGTAIGAGIGGVIGGIGGAILGGRAGRAVAEGGYDYVEGLTTPNLGPQMDAIDERERKYLRERTGR